MKKKLIITLSIIISFISGFSHSENVFLTDSKSLIGILLTVLGLCFSGFSFVSTSINNVILSSKYNKNLILKSKKIISSIEEDIFLILYLTILLIIINLFFYVDIPLIVNPTNVNFGIFVISSLKCFIFNFMFSLCFCLSFYAFYDLIRATFNLIKKQKKPLKLKQIKK